MALTGGDHLVGILSLVVEDQAGESLLGEVMIDDMDIDPETNTVTMFVNSDISYGNDD